MPIPNATEEHRVTPMLPLPGAPSSSWARFYQRIKTIFNGADFKVCISFWVCGLINNVLYVVILSAALDLVGPNVPKGVVLLADVIPSFGMKLVAPYFIQAVPYSVRILVFVLFSAAGMLLVASSPSYVEGGTMSSKIAGIILASLSSGGGEMSFVGLTHFYGPLSLASWGSGTGAAGLVGAGAYTLATTSLGFSVRTAILASACLPAVMVVSYFIILPKDRLRYASPIATGDYQSIVERGGLPGQDESNEEGREATGEENDRLLSPSGTLNENHKATSSGCANRAWQEFKTNLRRAQGLFFPFMLPLLLVYIAEYTINQGVSPNLLFPLNESPFSEFREFYPTYNAMYQVGVFISRSSIPFIRVHHLYFPSLLQVANLAMLTLHALFDFVPSVYIIFAIIFWEGLLGGLVYVNTFAEIGDRVSEEDREFSLAATTVSDSGGICIAGFLSMAVEVWLCNFQDAHGRDYCRKI